MKLNGIPTSLAPESSTTYFVRDPQGAWYPSSDNLLHEVEASCIKMYGILAEKVFGTMNNYHVSSPLFPELVTTSGMNSESIVSKSQFEELLRNIPDDFPISINQALYLADCFKLVSSIQESNKEVMQLQGEFYFSFNCEEMFYPKIEEPDGIRYVTSPVVTKLYAMLSFIYIRMHSMLDYTTKLALECENIKTDFDTYPRLASKNKLYSDKRGVSLNNVSGTIFASCSFINEIEAIRNHVIHNGLLDDLPKAYRVVADGCCVEKFILLPDINDSGRFESYKNRNLFFSQENKINEKLPSIINEFQKRLIETLEQLAEEQKGTVSTAG
ncbi:hypothetical protein ND925_17655 [Vibrio diabolicus]|uniref:hypothetical protein n=1 Tax=Vibrio diabolicus TaxID=50719 RepID=UPI002160D756|nr:hypothetical protein [Vibrio diabolicus]MCS0384583.1 hypothetical protein [Vibrio diabolicus]